MVEPTRVKVRVPARRLAWLHGELVRWQAEDLLDADAARRIADRYAAGRRLGLERLVLLLGGGFLGVGLIWIVAANLDRLSPVTRFAGITLVWLAAVVLGEILTGPAARSAARLVAVLAAGGVIFQAAQSLHVPAYSSGLLGVWAGGALAYAYATRAAGPLVAALAIGSFWYGWWAGDQAGAAGVALSLVAAAAAAVCLAIVHEGRPATADAGDAATAGTAGGAGDGAGVAVAAAGGGGGGAAEAGGAAAGGTGRGGGGRTAWWGGGPIARAGWSGRFAAVWRCAGFLLALSGLFVAAFPGVGRADLSGSPAIWTGVAAAIVAAGAALSLGDPGARREVLVALVLIIATAGLVSWSPGDLHGPEAGLTGAQTARALTGTLIYILAASWFAASGARRDVSSLVAIATAALVVFVTAQSFAVFQPLLSGAALFLALGVIFIVTGALAEYGRRRLLGVRR
ncbi:hypothetical protein Sme01_43300 [Sphaerisporangium melleum]|uniref:DUF2157 domain-containing protein n=1 Tax=Sphaerisporangium melleum TaxID=321316 RepID=A0A917QYV4_9ACTN|nr:DUF2157 domain-containing protein [Sphaerisporangium melleum]GGK77433.1 hypothetical protein GCM10007964_20260 [Sphaerisporangium melleum]GII71854.1 hypothetical protein Sme01_43300 [Sphaerisporangium melleum]